MSNSYLLFVVLIDLVLPSVEPKCNSQQIQCDDSSCIESAFLCDGIPDCSDASDEEPRSCKIQLGVRLTEGDRGRLELRYGSVWGTVCNNGFGKTEAMVACRMLGQDGGKTISIRPYRLKPGRHSPIWLDRISCGGWENNLDECSHLSWGHAFCSHVSDVAIQCGATTHSKGGCPGCFPGGYMNLQSPTPESTHLPSFSTTSMQEKKTPRNMNITSKNHEACRKLRRKKRIVGGRVIQLEETPWQGSVRLRSGADGSHLCGAIILSSNAVLTAAHCVHLKPRVVLRVRVGDWNTSSTEHGEQEFKVKDVVVHPEYYNNGRPFNDLAILKLKQNEGRGIEFGRTVEAACLSTQDEVYRPGIICTVTGWGQTNRTENVPSNILRAADVPILSDSECSLRNVLRGNVGEGMFCAGFLSNSNADACYGDSGGALTCVLQGSAVVAGMTSWGIACADVNKPGVYVKLSHYLDWINAHIQDT